MRLHRNVRTWAYVMLFSALALAAQGCALTSGGPYKEGCYRFGLAGKAIEEDLVPATTDAQRMKYQAFHDAVEDALRLGQEK